MHNLGLSKRPPIDLKNLPSNATLAALIVSSRAPQALALDSQNPSPNPPPVIEVEVIKPSALNSSSFSQNLLLTALKPQTQNSSDIPDGTNWRYSEFMNTVQKGKVERVRFNKEGGVLQLKNPTDGKSRVGNQANIGWTPGFPAVWVGKSGRGGGRERDGDEVGVASVADLREGEIEEDGWGTWKKMKEIRPACVSVTERLG